MPRTRFVGRALVLVLLVTGFGCDPCSFGKEWEREMCEAGREDVWLTFTGLEASSYDGAHCYVFREQSTPETTYHSQIYAGRLASRVGAPVVAPAPLRAGNAAVIGRRPAVGCSGESMLVAWESAGGTLQLTLAEGASDSTQAFSISTADDAVLDLVVFTGTLYIIVWHDSRDLRATRVTQDGKVLDAAGLVLGPAGGYVSVLAAPEVTPLVQWYVYDVGWFWAQVLPNGDVVPVDMPAELAGATMLSNPVAQSPTRFTVVAKVEGESMLAEVNPEVGLVGARFLGAVEPDVHIAALAAGNDAFGALLAGGNVSYEFVALDRDTLEANTAVAVPGAPPKLIRTGDSFVVLSAERSVVGTWFDEHGTSATNEPVVLLESEYLGTNY